jgi:DNA-binding CsgD family transcriptional regulator
MSTNLDPIEVRVAELVTAGRSISEVAIELGISRRTAQWHLAKSSRKLDVRSCSELADALALLRASAERQELEATE